MYCAECGVANPIGSETCEVCGSPLIASSGNMNCQACGAPVEEHDRFCRACGQSQSGASAVRFDPGPSFVDDASHAVDPSGLPPWLRDTNEPEAQTGNDHVSPPTSAGQTDDVSPWLDSAEPVNGPDHSASSFADPGWSGSSQPDEESAETSSLISEDDMPEWLRSLGDEESDSEQPVPQVTSATASPPSVAPIVPAISRAWLSRARGTESESPEEIGADFEPLESGPTAGPKRETNPRTGGLTPEGVSEQDVPVVNEAAGSPAKTHSGRARLLVLIIVVVLVVILGYFVVSNFL